MLPSAPLFSFKRGQHACVFYRDETSLLELLVPYVVEGLKQKEKCFLAQPQHMWRRIRGALVRVGIDPDREQQRGALEWHPVEEVYGSCDEFDPQRLMAILEQAIADALQRGFDGLRTAGELCWAANADAPLCERLLEYERLVELAFPHRPAVGICQYPLAAFTPELLERIFEQHRLCVQQEDATHTVLTLRNHSTNVDVIADRNTPGSMVYYVLQQRGTTDVLGWGSAPDVNAAIAAAEQLATA